MTNHSKQLKTIKKSPGMHWVGNGFPVHNLFSYPEWGSVLSPFLLLDYAAKWNFPPTKERLGVGEHPHKGFETVTIVYAGEVEHRDSSGGGGKIGPGDVQWMTAGNGIVHEEFHGRTYAQRGGPFQLVQLWVNLPAEFKGVPPAYQAIQDHQIPKVELKDSQCSLRVIAGSFGDVTGPAQTYTPMNVWDLEIHGNKELELPCPQGHTTVLVVLEGTIFLDEKQSLLATNVGIFDREGDTLRVLGADHAKVLLLGGQPIEEPIAGNGPFVMNNMNEIRQAYWDYQQGNMGHLQNPS